MNRFPTNNQVATALAWLRCNEGEGAEREACTAVADWLEIETNSRLIRSAARAAGVPTAVARLRLNERKGQP